MNRKNGPAFKHKAIDLKLLRLLDDPDDPELQELQELVPECSILQVRQAQLRSVDARLRALALEQTAARLTEVPPLPPALLQKLLAVRQAHPTEQPSDGEQPLTPAMTEDSAPPLVQAPEPLQPQAVLNHRLGAASDNTSSLKPDSAPLALPEAPHLSQKSEDSTAAGTSDPWHSRAEPFHREERGSEVRSRRPALTLPWLSGRASQPGAWTERTRHGLFGKLRNTAVVMTCLLLLGLYWRSSYPTVQEVHNGIFGNGNVGIGRDASPGALEMPYPPTTLWEGIRGPAGDSPPAPVQVLVASGPDSIASPAELTVIEANRVYHLTVAPTGLIQLVVTAPPKLEGSTWSTHAILTRRAANGTRTPLSVPPLYASASAEETQVRIGHALQLSALTAHGLLPDETLEITVVREQEVFRIDLTLLKPTGTLPPAAAPEPERGRLPPSATVPGVKPASPR